MTSPQVSAVPERTVRARHRAAALVAALGLTALAGCGGGGDTAQTTSGFTESNPDGMHGAVLTDQYVVPDATLTATDGSDHGNVSGVYADRDPIRPIYFAVVHRGRCFGLNNGFFDLTIRTPLKSENTKEAPVGGEIRLGYLLQPKRGRRLHGSILWTVIPSIIMFCESECSKLTWSRC